MHTMTDSPVNNFLSPIASSDGLAERAEVERLCNMSKRNQYYEVEQESFSMSSSNAKLSKKEPADYLQRGNRYRAYVEDGTTIVAGYCPGQFWYNKQEVGHRLFEKRNEKNITQEQLVRALQDRYGFTISVKTYGNCERGVQEMNHELTMAVATFYGVSMEEFCVFGGTERYPKRLNRPIAKKRDTDVSLDR